MQEADTFFGEALDRWTDLNCTKNFGKLLKVIAKKL